MINNKVFASWNQELADQSFESIPALQRHCAEVHTNSIEKIAKFATLRVEAQEQDLVLSGQSNVRCHLTNHSFHQLCRLAEVPYSYASKLPPTLAAQNLNWGMKNRAESTADKRDANTLVHVDPESDRVTLRSIMSEHYSRHWNDELVSDVVDMLQNTDGEWTPANFTKGDGKGIFASDHNINMFLVNMKKPIDDGSDRPMFRALFLRHSEDGHGAVNAKAFYFRSYCKNSNFFGIKGLEAVSVHHKGRDIRGKAMTEIRELLSNFSDVSEREVLSQIQTAKQLTLGAGQDEVVDRLYKMRIDELSQKRLNSAYAFAETSGRYGAPNTVWAMAQAITELSQQVPFMERRVALDLAAGRILALAA